MKNQSFSEDEEVYIEYKPPDEDFSPAALRSVLIVVLMLGGCLVFLCFLTKPKLDMLQEGRIPDPGSYNTAIISQNSTILMSLMEPEYESQLLEDFRVKFQERLERYPFVFGTLDYNGRQRSVEDLNYIRCLWYTQAEYRSQCQGLEESLWMVSTSANHNFNKDSYYGAALTYTQYWKVTAPNRITVGERNFILNLVQDKIQEMLDGMTEEELNSTNLLVSVQKGMDEICEQMRTEQMTVRCEVNAIRPIQDCPPEVELNS